MMIGKALLGQSQQITFAVAFKIILKESLF